MGSKPREVCKSVKHLRAPTSPCVTSRAAVGIAPPAVVSSCEGVQLPINWTSGFNNNKVCLFHLFLRIPRHGGGMYAA